MKERSFTNIAISNERLQYDQKGYAIYREVLDDQLIQESKQHVEWLAEQHPELRPEQYGHWLVKEDPFWVRLISDEQLIDIAEQYIGPNIALVCSRLGCEITNSSHRRPFLFTSFSFVDDSGNVDNSAQVGFIAILAAGPCGKIGQEAEE